MTLRLFIPIDAGALAVGAEEVAAAIRTGEAKAVCTFRDPRDCVASDIVFLGQGLEAFVHGRTIVQPARKHSHDATRARSRPLPSLGRPLRLDPARR